MMSFYLGKEVKKYHKKFEVIKEHYMPQVHKSSNAAIFRHIVDVLYNEINRVNGKEENHE
ncbi:MAG: hypothetical protein ACFFG0_15370 [Candidatus Thorarchaeota archaeon]